MGYYNVPGEPAGVRAPDYGPPPNSYLVWAILATLFCCMPFGVVSIVFAAQVSSKWSAGDIYGAADYSSKARGWLIASVACGVVILIIYVIIFLAIRNSATTP